MDRGSRISAIPPAIHERAMHDPIIKAAMYRYAESDDILEAFLVKLVLLLSDSNAQQNARFVEYVERGPAPLVIVRKA